MISSLAKTESDFDSERTHHPIDVRTTSDGMRVACYAMPLDRIPCDFFADPDGLWTFEGLTRAAQFPADGVAIGALRRSFNGHPEGAAVVTLNAETRPYVAIIECPIAYVYAEPPHELSVTAA